MSANPPLRDWAGRRVWVIGASSGIGAALAAALCQRGAQVWVSARRADRLADWVAQHPGSQALPLDITDASAVSTAVETAWRDGPLDLVCCCAAHYRPMRADAIDWEDWLRHHDTNLVGVMRLCHAVLPRLRAQGQGHLSLVASVAGYRGLPNSLAYGPTKAALIHLAEILYLDLHRQGLGISVVNPGFVETPLTADNAFHMPALMRPEQAAQAMLKGWAQGRFEIHFPGRFTWVLKILRCLPYRWYFALIHRFTGL